MINFKLIIFTAMLVFTRTLLLANDTTVAQIRLHPNLKGIKEMSWSTGGMARNYIDSGYVLGTLNLKYKINDSIYTTGTQNQRCNLLANTNNRVKLSFCLPAGLNVTEEFYIRNNDIVTWSIDVLNTNNSAIDILDFSFPLPIGQFVKKLPAAENFNQHSLIDGSGSFCYWIPYAGTGNILLMTLAAESSLEYFTHGENEILNLYTNASTAVDRKSDTWPFPSTSQNIQPGKHIHNQFNFQIVHSVDEIRDILYSSSSLDVRVAPGMTIPDDLSLYCLMRSKASIKNLIAQYPEETTIKYAGKKSNGYHLYKINFRKLGENLITVLYGNNQKAYLNFFCTEPLETLIKKRARFITARQQIKDSLKWYNGLYSIWDMQNAKLLSPDDKGPLPDFVVGGSDDPSNCKPLYVSEKNVVYPDSTEIASLEYYERNFVWGKLQRTGDEYPYPYGIYGSDNWYQNRSGKVAGYNSGGSGKERMWRTFDYTTHFAIYYNLYKIAKNSPAYVHYLDARGYLDRAYKTAMAFFTVPYTIKMGQQWNFHGWSDWAYKQGNFHERYIIDLIDALNNEGKCEEADVLKREWEKKVKYFIYDDPWPFGSEFAVDRTAFESTYYIAQYAKNHKLTPQEQLWYDKNTHMWYSHLHISDSATNIFLVKQLNANLALRGTIEPEFNLLGTAWASNYDLDYMSQMAGVAILDYALNFSNNPAKYINIGYNSLLSSWALMNTGNEKSNYGYWYPNKLNDGAVGWVFTPWQHSTTYFKNVPAKRGVWQYDGEIDHGLVSAIHDASSILIKDSLFGLICYGCETFRNNNNISLIPKDGVRENIHVILNNTKLSLKLAKDGFAKDLPVTFFNHFTQLDFYIENREGTAHNTFLLIQNFTPGVYAIYSNGRLCSKFSITATITTIPIKVVDKEENIHIIKQNVANFPER